MLQVSQAHNGFDFFLDFFLLFLPFPAIAILKTAWRNPIYIDSIRWFFVFFLVFWGDIKLKISEGRFFGLFPSAAPPRLH